jgi:hypothetical protein
MPKRFKHKTIESWMGERSEEWVDDCFCNQSKIDKPAK